MRKPFACYKKYKMLFSISMKLLPFSFKQIMTYIFALFCITRASPDIFSLAISFPFIMFGEFIRVWGTGHLRKNQAVVTSGPYSYIRDPLYLGTLLISTGFTIAGKTWELLIIVWAVFFLYYMPYKRKREGDRLSRIFGKTYDDYRKEVRSLIPRLTPYKGTDYGNKWSAKLVSKNSEVGIIVLVIVWFLLLIIKMLWFHDMVFPKY